MRKLLIGLVVLSLVIVACQQNTGKAPQEGMWSDLRSMEFPENYPTQEATQRLYDEMLFHRATQVVLWSLPAATLWAMKKRIGGTVR